MFKAMPKNPNLNALMAGYTLYTGGTLERILKILNGEIDSNIFLTEDPKVARSHAHGEDGHILCVRLYRPVLSAVQTYDKTGNLASDAKTGIEYLLRTRDEVNSLFAEAECMVVISSKDPRINTRKDIWFTPDEI